MRDLLDPEDLELLEFQAVPVDLRDPELSKPDR
jgi:hypothetical protein